jgi:TPR repeat protein
MGTKAAYAPDISAPPSALDARLQVLTTLPPEHLTALLAGDPTRAAPWVRAAAEAGLAEGQVRYGRMLLDGTGVPQDRAAAYRWFLRAGAGGDAEGQNMVGRCFENGWGVAADPAEAARWFAHAADQGHAWACYNLGHLYLDGLGVAQDRDRAFTLYRQAAETGHVRALNLLGRCFEEGWGVAVDADQAREAYRRSAEGGYFRGQYNFATLLVREGRIAQAVDWFEKALDGAVPASRAVMARRLAESGVPEIRAEGLRALSAVAAPCKAV